VPMASRFFRGTPLDPPRAGMKAMYLDATREVYRFSAGATVFESRGSRAPVTKTRQGAYDDEQMITVRDALAPLLEAPGAYSLRHRLTVRRARRDDAGTRLSAQRRDVMLLQDVDLVVPEGRGRSDELFILGSGPSALELTEANKKRMRAGTTIGLNSWALHDFIPDAYSFEEMQNDQYVSVAAGLSAVLARQDVLDANPLLLHLRSRLTTPSRRLVAIPPGLQSNTRYYGRVNVETRRVGNLEYDLVALLRAHRNGALAPHVLIDSGSTVARMMSLGILRGFASIVLIGVDLNSSRYFFEDDPSYLKRNNLDDFNPQVSRSATHDTEETLDRNFPASTFIPALARASEATGGPAVYVGSKSSKLSSEMDVLDW